MSIVFPLRRTYVKLITRGAILYVGGYLSVLVGLKLYTLLNRDLVKCFVRVTQSYLYCGHNHVEYWNRIETVIAGWKFVQEM